jgi:hypothetical protein
MVRKDILNELKMKFTDERGWQDFLGFVDSHKVRGDAKELWLQWEIHLLKTQAAGREWSLLDRRFMAPGMKDRSPLFQ